MNKSKKKEDLTVQDILGVFWHTSTDEESPVNTRSLKNIVQRNRIGKAGQLI